MKVKLLKKVRKRFEIYHLPNGFTDSNGYKYKYNLYRLEDYKYGFLWDAYAQLGGKLVNNNDKFKNFTDDIFDTEQECIAYLKSRIISRLRQEGFRGRKEKNIEKKIKKVWYIK